MKHAKVAGKARSLKAKSLVVTPVSSQAKDEMLEGS